MIRALSLALAVTIGLGSAAPVQALDRPLPRPVADLSAMRPVPRADGIARPDDAPARPLRPTARPVRDAAPDLAAQAEAALLAQAARGALQEAFPGAEVTRAATATIPLAPAAGATSDLLRLADPALAAPLPVLRPAGLVEVMSARGASALPDGPAPPRSVRPVTRLDAAQRAERLVLAAMAAPDPLIAVDGTLLRSPRPALRPELHLALGRLFGRGDVVSGGGGGGLCTRSSIRGERIAPVRGAGSCGIPDAVRVTQVSGVALSRSARMDCATAQALDDWVRKGVLPTVGSHGGGVVALEVAAGYSCRTRNNQPGARVSEHGKGRAIDISGIRLANGEVISVLRDWGKGTGGRMLQAMWRAACGPFGTVLGPNSDRFHRDHFHFDTARYRSGSYCR